MFVPLTYNLRSLWVRRSQTLLTVLGIAATVAIVAGVLALQQGFSKSFQAGGREDLAIFLRPGATGETDSIFRRDLGQRLIGTLSEIEVGANGPLASMECYLAVLHSKADGGKTNVPLRGVQPKTFELRGDEIRIVQGQHFALGKDEVIVGSKLVGRLQGCTIGETIVLNTTPFRVVGVFEHEGAFSSEIWGDLERFMPVLGRYGPNRVVAKLKPGTDLEALNERLGDNKEVPAKAITEREYLASQTQALSGVLLAIGKILAFIMGIGAIFTAINTMLASVSARTSEIGILLAMGYRPLPIFFSFMFEALVLGLLGGIVGCIAALPFNGIETGTMNFQTFTEFAFAFRVTPFVLFWAVVFATTLGLIGGAWPAYRACSLSPTEALRRA